MSSAFPVLDRHRLVALVEPLREDPTFVAKPMFGLVACYVSGRLVIVLADRRDPWRGVMLPMEKRFHDEVREAFPELRVHPVLRKWLHLPEGGAFHAVASRIVAAIAAGDSRFGVEPDPPRLPRYRFE